MRMKIVSVKRRFSKEAYRKGRADRLHVWIEGENVLENLMFRHNRPHKLYKELIEAQRFLGAGLLPDWATMRWSQKAGCGCGCSPGFVLDTRTGTVVSVTVTVEADDLEIAALVKDALVTQKKADDLAHEMLARAMVDATETTYAGLVEARS